MLRRKVEWAFLALNRRIWRTSPDSRARSARGPGVRTMAARPHFSTRRPRDVRRDAVPPEPAGARADAPPLRRSAAGIVAARGRTGLQRRGRGLLDPVDAASGAPGSDDPRRCCGHLARGFGDRRGGRLRPSDRRDGARVDIQTADRGRDARDVRLERRSGSGQALPERRHRHGDSGMPPIGGSSRSSDRRISWLRTTSSATWMHRVPNGACGTSRSSRAQAGISSYPASTSTSARTSRSTSDGSRFRS